MLPGIEESDFDWTGTFTQVSQGGEPTSFAHYSKLLDRWYKLVAYSDETGYFVTVFYDMTEHKQRENRERRRNQILTSLAKGEPLAINLELIIRSLEAEDPETLGSILLLDDEGQHLLHGAAPSLPDFYNLALHGLKIGEGIGSCGTAAYTGQRVVVEDILTHPYWKDFRKLAQKANLRSCWSEPVLSSAGKVLATFAVYHREPRVPSNEDIERIKVTASLVSLAIEQKQAEKQLQEAYRRQDEIIEFLPDATFVIDHNGIVVAWNKAIEEMTGIPKKDMLGKCDYEYSLPFYGKRRPILIDLTLRPENKFSKLKKEYDVIDWKGHTLYSETYVPGTYGGKGAYLWATASKLYDNRGDVVGAIETLRDITRHRQAEKDLIYQKELQEALFKNTPDAIVAFDENHKIIDINQNFCDLLGYKLEEVKGKDLDDILEIGKEKSAPRDFTRAILSGEKVVTEGVLYSKEGHPVEVSIKGIPVIIDGKVAGGYGIYTDITERKHYEKELFGISLVQNTFLL